MMKHHLALAASVLLTLAGCGEERRTADWYSANPKVRDAQLAKCASAQVPATEIERENCKQAEMSAVRDLTGPSRVKIR